MVFQWSYPCFAWYSQARRLTPGCKRQYLPSQRDDALADATTPNFIEQAVGSGVPSAMRVACDDGEMVATVVERAVRHTCT